MDTTAPAVLAGAVMWKRFPWNLVWVTVVAGCGEGSCPSVTDHGLQRAHGRNNRKNPTSRAGNDGELWELSVTPLTHLTPCLRKTSKELLPRDGISLFHTEILHKLRADVADPREKLPRWTAEAVAATSLMGETPFCLFFLK